MTPDKPETASSDFILTREFDAPRDLVWKAFTEPERMKHWWGPKGFTVIVSKMDLRPGGTYHCGMQASGGGPVMWGRFVYREVVAPERLVFINSFSDETGGVTRHPLSPTWPLEMLSTFTFEDLGGKTRLTIRWSVYQATDAERRTFDSSHDSMRMGWGGTLDQLAEYLAKAR
jgi:uncharacterized protein YndB with AHSA1/START domain